jgi:hypothetical protein
MLNIKKPKIPLWVFGFFVSLNIRTWTIFNHWTPNTSIALVTRLNTRSGSFGTFLVAGGAIMEREPNLHTKSGME